MLMFNKQTDGTYTLALEHTRETISRQDFKSLEHAEEIASSVVNTDDPKATYIATETDGCWPRFDVIRVPAVGDEVSQAFNGDSYPCGVIVSISKSLRVVTVTDGTKFWRRRQTGAWVRPGSGFSLIGGHVRKYNRSF